MSLGSNHLSQSQIRLLNSLEEQTAIDSEAEGPDWLSSSVQFKTSLVYIHDTLGTHSLDLSFDEWENAAGQFYDDRLLLMLILDEVMAEGEAFLAAGRTFHIGAAFSFRAADMISEERYLGSAPERDEKYSEIISKCIEYLNSLLTHCDAVDDSNLKPVGPLRLTFSDVFSRTKQPSPPSSPAILKYSQDYLIRVLPGPGGAGKNVSDEFQSYQVDSFQ